ncbi:MAG: hypothetical protein HYZ09_03345 [Candidatus Kerfeldbacteria bacterium]|nr:hypothetical protein [Candidatus Kerfeldbacteria bacterium]
MDDEPQVHYREQDRYEHRQPHAPARLLLRRVSRSRWLALSALLALAVSAGSVVVFAFAFRGLDHHIVLHYTTLFGIDWLGSWAWALLLPAGFMSIVALNVVLVAAATDQRFIHHVVAATNVLLVGLLVVASVLLVQVNRTFA